MMLTPEDAWAQIEARIRTPAPRTVARAAAGGATLASPLPATADIPPADVSAMDGYACAGEVATTVPLPVVGIAAAGTPPDFSLQPGETAKIMTGGVVPVGADRVIPVEQTDGGYDRVVFHATPGPGDHIRRRAEIVGRGAALLPAGTLLTPGAISLLAAHGHGEMPVFLPPSVAVLTTGDELVPPEAEPAAGQLRDSNTAFLLAACQTLGLEARSLGIAPDRVDDLRQRIATGLEADVLLLCGGVSMGEFDLVEGVLEELGCEALFERVAIQPGKPLVVARHGQGWVFGLPGNPASVMVTFWLFVRPLLRRLLGIHDGYWHGALCGELAAPLPGSKGRDRFLPADVRFTEGRLLVRPHPPKGSHDVVAYAHGTALVRIPPHAAPRTAGESCEILPLASWTAGDAEDW